MTNYERYVSQPTSHSDCRNFSTLQKLRLNFVPSTPSSIADVTTTKISFETLACPFKDGLKELFPTLLKDGAEGMP